MSNNDDIKKVLEAINSFTPANSALTVDSETPNVEQDGVRITKEGIEEAWDTMEAPKAKEATADADKAVTEHDSGEDVTLTVNTPTEIKVPSEQADMIANMLKLAGVEVGDAPSMDAPDMDSPMDMDADGENMPMVIPTDDEAGDDEEAPLMGACASEEVSEAKDKMVCKHCGDEIHKPVSKSCECDCNDENGDHWVKENKEMAEVEESIEKAWNENVPATEAVGSFADPILDLCDEIGCDPDHPVFADLVRYLDGDTIADFVKEFRSNHEYDNGMEYESVEVDEKVSDTAWSTGDAIMYKGKEIDTAKLDYDMQDISDGIYELNAPVMYTDGTEVADEDMNDLYDLPELNDWIFQHYTSESVEESDTAWSTGDAIMYKGKEIDLRRLDYDMQDISDGIYQINAPAYYTDGTEIADGDYDGLYDLPELNDYIHQDYTSESVEEGAMSGIHQDAQEMDKEEFEAKYPQFPDMWDEVHSQMNEESKRILGLSGVPVAEAQSPAQKAAFEKMLANKKGNKKDDKDEVAEAVTTTDLITKYQGSEVDINDMNRLLKLSGMGELDESKLANAPAGTSMDEPKEHDKLPSEVGKGSGNSDYINRADGQGENPMGMHTADDVEESFTTALGEYRKFVAEGIMGKKTKKAKK